MQTMTDRLAGQFTAVAARFRRPTGSRMTSRRRPIAVPAMAWLLATAVSPARADLIITTIQPPGVQAISAPGQICAAAATCVVGTETFENGFGGTTTYPGSGGLITGTYAGDWQILPPNRFGGAGGTGHYIVAPSARGYTIDFTVDASLPGVNYFGFWLSALDRGNHVVLYKEGAVVGRYDPANLLAAVGQDASYFGNPNAPFQGDDAAEPFAFVSLYDATGTFDQVRIFEDPIDAIYETDNHTVGYISPSPPVELPEPGGLALLAGAVALLVGARSLTRPGNRPARR